MTKSADALIKPELLIWARKSAGMSLEIAAQKLKIPVEKLESWETGTSRPTVKQLRKVASIYKQSFAAFYLSKAPEIFYSPLKDFRRLPGIILREFSPELLFDIRFAMDKRGIYLDLLKEQDIKPPIFSAVTSLDQNPEHVGSEVRKLLDISIKTQKKWRDNRAAFNAWRESFENQDILLFQSTKIKLFEMRGYSVAEFPLPIIVVNRKDSYSGRIFTMLHEIVHLMLHISGICDLNVEQNRFSEEQTIEIFCNHAAGSALVPKDSILSEPIVKSNYTQKWQDESLYSLAKMFKVSREVILRRLLILGRTNNEFYESKREQFQKEYEDIPKSKGFVPPSTDVISAAGKPFIRRVLESFYTDRITTSDLSDYLGVKLKHIDKIIQSGNL